MLNVLAFCRQRHGYNQHIISQNMGLLEVIIILYSIKAFVTIHIIIMPNKQCLMAVR